MSGDASLRAQLLEARCKLERQIEILQAGPVSTGTCAGGLIDYAPLIAELSGELREIEDTLAGLRPGDQAPD